jgi:hypothetical protein
MNQPPWSYQICETHLSKGDLDDLQINTDNDDIGGHTLTPIKGNARSLSRASGWEQEACGTKLMQFKGR